MAKSPDLWPLEIRALQLEALIQKGAQEIKLFAFVGMGHRAELLN